MHGKNLQGAKLSLEVTGTKNRIDYKRSLSYAIFLGTVGIWILCSLMRDPLSGTRYIVPLGGPFFIESFDQSDSIDIKTKYGPFEIVKVSKMQQIESWNPIGIRSGDANISIDNMCNIEEISTASNLIIGKTKSIYFSLSRSDLTLQMFNSKASFQKALNETGIDGFTLSDPAQLARSLPGATIRPWAYRSMNGLLKMSDLRWSDMFENVGLLSSVILGLAADRHKGSRERRSIWVLAIIVVLLAVLVNYLGNACILESGPDFFIGNIYLPIEFVTAAIFSSNIIRWIETILTPSPYRKELRKLERDWKKNTQ